ncbi:MAG TPA: holo-ACP synthase [Verrucomicrobiae bacterium]|nr:holo-ACP synthase [Verrucomicrobiae bacterium]
MSEHTILGTGVDIIETARIQDSLDKFGERFLKRCFWPDEVAYCLSMKFPALHFAARFAAKEAISKAFGTGIGKELGWRDMEIRRRDSGEPFVALHDKGEDLARARGVAEIFVSLSHCREYAAAHAVIVGRSTSAR